MGKLKVKIASSGEELEMNPPENLRKFLMRVQPGFLYKSPMNVFHCRGIGSCGTCAVKLTGKVNMPTKMEKWRLNFPPHEKGLSKGLRLACQCVPEGDVEVEKPEGLWGQGRG